MATAHASNSKALPAHGIVGDFRVEDSWREVVAPACVAGAVDFTHAACAEGSDDFVWSEFVACGKRHLSECWRPLLGAG
jgi:hypothetical protein